MMSEPRLHIPLWDAYITSRTLHTQPIMAPRHLEILRPSSSPSRPRQPHPPARATMAEAVKAAARQLPAFRLGQKQVFL